MKHKFYFNWMETFSFVSEIAYLERDCCRSLIHTKIVLSKVSTSVMGNRESFAKIPNISPLNTKNS